MPDNILNYQPPQINRQPVQYMNSLLGPMEVEEHSEPSDPKDRPMTDDEKIASGLYDGNPGYGGASGHEGMFTVSDIFGDRFGKFGSKPPPTGSYGSTAPEPGEAGYGVYGAQQAGQGYNAATGKKIS